MVRDACSPFAERDACGIGFVAHLDGTPAHAAVDDGLALLERLEHRGACGCDGTTGDGAGLLVQLPDAFFRRADDVPALPPRGRYAAGTLFLPPGDALQQACRHAAEATLQSRGLGVLGWRRVPVRTGTLGPAAAQTEPAILQVFAEPAPVASGTETAVDPAAFERRLYLARRVVKQAIRTQVPQAAGTVHIASLSSETIVYKGMLTAGQLRRYFPDLSDPHFASAFALVHARFSTNTLPRWSLAQPFRALCHNGEINTLRGNVNRMRARESRFDAHELGPELQRLGPLLDLSASDSSILDAAVDLLRRTGRSLPHALRMLVPPAWEHDGTLSPERRAFFRYHACLTEAWDGPAALAFADGRRVGALLDRNGLRPARYTVTTDDRVILASEAGALELDAATVAEQGRLGPGQMLVVDLNEHRLLTDRDVTGRLARRRPYRDWLDAHLATTADLPTASSSSVRGLDLGENGRRLHGGVPGLGALHHAFGYSREDLRILLGPMARSGRPPVGSMGDDTPLAVLSNRPRLLYDHFRQLFAQVTNPPLDAIREAMVTSLDVYLGAEGSLLAETPAHARRLHLDDPILSPGDLQRLHAWQAPSFRTATLNATFAPGDTLAGALHRLHADASRALDDGASLLVLSDARVGSARLPVPMLLAVASVHHHLIRDGRRTRCSLLADSFEPRETHHVCCLLGHGADAVCPRGAYATIRHLARGDARDGALNGTSPDVALQRYRTALRKGILKVMSKMGLSTLQSYQGAQIFEAVGLADAVVDDHFTHTPRSLGGEGLGGIGLDVVEERVRKRHAAGFGETSLERPLDVGGRYQWRRGGEEHALTPTAIASLQHATRGTEASRRRYRDFAAEVNRTGPRAHDLRGLLRLVDANGHALPIGEVEPWTSIVQRFKTGAMSYGSISDETHRTLAEAMNRLGGKSNTGEGGEHPERYADAHPARSRIKQVASGRFGVTLPYLASADEIQIKMAQGAKPGEGGQLPGEKVYPWIAEVRHSTPGVPLISPPPHHDIYSIEDLAQLIFDLKNAAPEARISVKLVSAAGVGTVAAGVAKAHADHILISGHSGGTGASPQTSIMHAGLPWETGIADAHQVLVEQGLRRRVSLEADGGLRTGRDVAVAALLGAEEFGFSTAPLISLGCIMMRKCHLNTCPVGIATQDPELREKFDGTPEQVVNYFYLVAEELREIMARLGMQTVDDMVGRTDRLRPDPAAAVRGLRLAPLLRRPTTPAVLQPFAAATEQDHGLGDALDHRLIEEAEPVLGASSAASAKPLALDVSITNRHRTVGTMLSRAIVDRFGDDLPPGTLTLRCDGTAGQSFAAFGIAGLTFDVRGAANDYLGKGLSGARIVLQPPAHAAHAAEDATVAGNVALYGATSGELFVRGRAGERFAVRNSGAHAVVEGVGDHGCEYMTGGCVVVLGPTGRNFAAGMSGGLAYVYNPDDAFAARCNREMVDLAAVAAGTANARRLQALVEAHRRHTDSPVAARLLERWSEAVGAFVRVLPAPFKKAVAEGRAAMPEPVGS